jgi:hypothetical protein
MMPRVAAVPTNSGKASARFFNHFSCSPTRHYSKTSLSPRSWSESSLGSYPASQAWNYRTELSWRCFISAPNGACPGSKTAGRHCTRPCHESCANALR